MAMDPWKDERTPTERILSRAAVEELDEHVIRAFVESVETAMRSGDMDYLVSIVGLDCRFSVPALKNGRIVQTTGGRDAFLMNLAAGLRLEILVRTR